MSALRLIALILHLVRGLATCALIFPFADRKLRNNLIERWSHALLTICGVELRVVQKQSASEVPRAMVVANHISWLDIFVINAAHPCRFVAKAEIRDWPLIGWLCEQAGTIFIARGRLRDVRRIYQGLVESLQAGDHVAFFPEGRVALQGDLLPFHSNLFEAAIEAQVPLQPCALRYVDREGRLHPAVKYVEPVNFVQSLWMILKGGPIRAELELLPVIPFQKDAHRRELAEKARSAIGRALNLGSSGAQTEPGA